MPHSNKYNLILVFGLLFMIISCSGNKETPFETTDQELESKNSITKSYFGTTKEGVAVDLYTLTNSNGVELKITNYGGIVTSLKVPDKQGEFEDVVLGYDSLSSYLEETPYFGAIVGRYANRIAQAKFTLDGQEYSLAQNNGENTLHGGLIGFDKVVWETEEIQTDNEVGLRLRYLSEDMEEGYPGNLEVEVHYTLDNENAFKIDYKATTDKKTVVNLTHHSYFNLKGKIDSDILDHFVTINASRFLPVDNNLIPTGELWEVTGTPFDFTQPKAIGERINDDNEQLKLGIGYDHCWVIDRENDDMIIVASVMEPTSGRIMEVYSTEPGIQLYTGNFLNGTITGKDGAVYNHRYGFCLETQHYPDSPNKPEFPSVVLEPGDTYQSSTVYKFLVKEGE